MKHALLLVLMALACAVEPTIEPELVAASTAPRIECQHIDQCPDGWYCAALPGVNECRPPCTTDTDCHSGSRCAAEVEWYDDGTPVQLVCERWCHNGWEC